MFKPLFQPHAYNSGIRLLILRNVCGAIMLASLLMFLASLPARFAGLTELATRAAPLLQAVIGERSIDWMTEWFPVLALAFEIIVMGLYLVNAFLVYQMRPDDWQALLTTAALSSFALHITPTLLTWMVTHPELSFLGIIMKSIGIGLALLFLYLFPGGYYAPSWMRLFTLAWVVWSVFWLFNPDTVLSFRDPYTISIPGFIALMLWWMVGFLSQAYRYLYVSGPLERQQSKFVFFGASFVFLGYCLYVPLREAMANQPQPELAQIVFQMIAPYVYLTLVAIVPIAIAFSILRYRLFDIDIIIRRTLVYAGLTLLLGLVYFASVVLLQTVFNALGGERSRTAIVLSTLGIAALANPLRQRLQRTIDRRFYRSKYDAEEALAQFAEHVRDEVDIERLCGHLASAVVETMQPQEVAIWLNRPAAANRPNPPKMTARP